MFDLSDYHLLQEGVTTRERVLKIMGSPTFTSDSDSEEVWVYYAEEVKNFLFFKPNIISRNVLVVAINRDNVVSSLQSFDLSSEDEKLNFSAKHTEVQSHKEGFFKSIFSNVGQVKPQ